MTDLTENVANKKVQDYVKKSHITTENEQKSEKTAQDVQKNCLSLTEKWKKGELINEEDAGCYYIETIDGEIYPDCLSPIDGFKNTYNYAVKKILAPVPSYETYLTMKDCAKMVFEAAERETKLKELLVECRDIVKENLEFSKSIGRNRIQPRNKGLLKRIDEVLK